MAVILDKEFTYKVNGETEEMTGEEIARLIRSARLKKEHRMYYHLVSSTRDYEDSGIGTSILFRSNVNWFDLPDSKLTELLYEFVRDIIEEDDDDSIEKFRFVRTTIEGVKNKEVLTCRYTFWGGDAQAQIFPIKSLDQKFEESHFPATGITCMYTYAYSGTN